MTMPSLWWFIDQLIDYNRSDPQPHLLCGQEVGMCHIAHISKICHILALTNRVFRLPFLGILNQYREELTILHTWHHHHHQPSSSSTIIIIIILIIQKQK